MAFPPDAELAAPLVEELPPALDAPTAFRRLASRNLPGLIWFDSARRHETLGRYSYVAASPIDWLDCGSPHYEKSRPSQHVSPRERVRLREQFRAGDGPFARLAAFIGSWRSARGATVAGLPPFQGGAAGLLGYDLGWYLEPHSIAVRDPFGAPAYAVGIYPTLLAFDHATNAGWLISHGWSQQGESRSHDLALQRLNTFKAALGLSSESVKFEPRRQTTRPAISSQALAPQRPMFGDGRLTSNFSRDEYQKVVQRAIDYIYAGDAFQVNVAQRLLAPQHVESSELYLRLREKNPAPFAGYFDAGDFQIASASPERFVQVLERRVETRPIKGTRQRVLMPEADLFSGDELLANEKDRAENVMIVDLLRNDLSRVCTPDSVKVTRLCGLEQYQFVQHLTSVIEGRLRDDCEPLDLIAAAFPGGSITGAPKPRAMEIIAELEGVARGAYCGSLFYLGHDGAFDSSILIRTITAGAGWLQAHVGGGITAASSPAAEYDETIHKAQGLAQVMTAEPR